METLSKTSISGQNQQIQETVSRERIRLKSFIKKRIPKNFDAEDILQEVYFELVETYRLMKPVEQLASWLFTVARNKITDLYRKKRPESLEDQYLLANDEDEKLLISEIIPANIHSAETQLWQETVMELLLQSLDELPEEQKEVFVMHEFEDVSFKEMGLILNVPIKTLISRKRYAVLHLRERLQGVYHELLDQ